MRFPDESSQREINAGKYYNQLIARVKYLEARLAHSATLKNEGLKNDDVKRIESGYSKSELTSFENKEDIIQINFGDQSRFVWKVQKKLISKGYDHVLDGLFGVDTQNAIVSFQQDNQLYPSGAMDDETFELLFFN